MKERKRYALPAAVFIALVRDNKVLLLRRSATGWMDNFYSLPAGSLDDGEELIRAACRECKEEVGVDVRPGDLRLVNSQHCFLEGHRWLNFFFATGTWQGEPHVCEPHKHSEVRWVSINALPDDLIPYVREGLRGFENKEAYTQFGWQQV